jgi:hypothetical protein
MAFPGDRLRQKEINIAAAAIPGSLNYDFLWTLTEADFAEDDLTLGGEFAIDIQALAASKESLGQFRYALDAIRVELNADYTLSKVEIVVRIPAGEITTLDGATTWLWWLSDTDTLPADDEDYGKFDVYNPITDSTGNSVPLTTRAAISFDEAPTDASPPFKDRSGSAQHCAPISTAGLSRVDRIPGRGLSGASQGLKTAAAFAPGLGEFAVIECLLNPGASTTEFFFASDYWNIALNTTQTRFLFRSGVGGGANVSTTSSAVRVAAMSRSGDAALVMSDESALSVTGLSALSYTTTTGAELVRAGSPNSNISLAYLLYSAPNQAWLTIFSRVISHTSGTIVSHASNAVGITGVWTEVVFAGLQEGTEARIFETPHAAIWELDLDGAASADIGADYVDFDVVTSTTTDRHYIWWTTDPALAGATGHQVTRSGGETDAQLAALASAVIDGIADVSATVSGAVITVTNALNGLTTKPVYHGLEGLVSVTQIGGTSSDEIDGIESSTGTSWAATVLVDSPRLAMITMLSIAFERVRFSTTLTQNGGVIPASALQREDVNYANPT